MKEQFTPGPWHIERHTITAQDGTWIAEVFGEKPDARLIAEAPEMFRLLQDMSNSTCGCPECQATRALIARVLGPEVLS